MAFNVVATSSLFGIDLNCNLKSLHTLRIVLRSTFPLKRPIALLKKISEYVYDKKIKDHSVFAFSKEN